MPDLASIGTQIEQLGALLAKQGVDLAEKIEKRDAEIATKSLSLATKTDVDKAAEGFDALKADYSALKEQILEMQRPGGGRTTTTAIKSLGDLFIEHLEATGDLKRIKDSKATKSADLVLKSFEQFPGFSPHAARAQKAGELITTMTTNFVPPEFSSGWIGAPQLALRMRDLMPVVPISSNSSVYYEMVGVYPTAGAAGVEVTSVTNVGGPTVTTATVTEAAHGLSTGDRVLIAGAVQTEYNGVFVVTVVSSSVFTYSFAGSSTTPATGTITFLKLSTPSGAAAGVAELATKPQASLSFIEVTALVKVIAQYIVASRQVMNDLPQLRSLVDNRLMFGVRSEEERQLLFGTGTNDEIQGIMTHARRQRYAWSSGAGSGSANGADQQLDAVRRARTLVERTNFGVPDGLIINPTESEAFDLVKDATGAYIIGSDPADGRAPRIWRMPVVVTNSMTAGRGLVGSFRMGSMLRDREDVNVRFSESDGTNFVKNALTILAEERVAAEWHTPDAFVDITFDNAPA